MGGAGPSRDPAFEESGDPFGEAADAVGEDVESAVVMGFLHDCARRNDKNDFEHARDSEVLARRRQQGVKFKELVPQGRKPEGLSIAPQPWERA